ncbi:hypothetical protein ACIBO1_27035 [Micromonospora sp. NPDC049903]|uniref:hypothetical protein n=1 Tax=Micromonospora sp. NPDC049903 TaxID=3364276 RepID=UPI00379C87A6
MTTPTALDMAVVLDRYRAGLRDVTDIELERRAGTVAALPGRLAAELRHLVDAEREYRQAVRRPASPPPALVLNRSRVVGAAAGVVSTGAVGAVLAGRALAEHVDQVPQALVYSPAVAVVLVAAGVGGRRLARWLDDRRHPLATDVAEADLNPLGRHLLAQVRAARQVRGEVS